MKKAIILFVVCIVFSVQHLFSQGIALNSEFANIKKIIIEANCNLSDSLEVHFIKNLSPKKFKRIVFLKKESFELLGRMSETNDTHQQIVYLENAIKYFNKAQSKYNKLITKKKP